MIEPYYQEDGITIYHGDALSVLKSLPDGLIDTCVTSPPYWGLRDYGTAEWDGGEADCDHSNGMDRNDSGERHGKMTGGPLPGGVSYYRDECGKCGATRIDQQLGLESTPAEFVAKMVELFREVRRVLKDDGTCWINLGDSYCASPAGNKTPSGFSQIGGKRDGKLHEYNTQPKSFDGLKPKDLCGIPWRVAFALQADGWYLRQDIIWAKPNPMPESVTDRCTKAHEYIFLLSKNKTYYYDADAIREPHAEPWRGKGEKESPDNYQTTDRDLVEGRQFSRKGVTQRIYNELGRNKRSVWTVNPKPYPKAHFATFPPELIKPCILAGTSEKGCCPDCSKPFVRNGDDWDPSCKCYVYRLRDDVPEAIKDELEKLGFEVRNGESENMQTLRDEV